MISLSFMFMMYLWEGFTGRDFIGRTLDDDCRHGSEGVDMFWSMSLKLESDLDSKWSIAKYTYSRRCGTERCLVVCLTETEREKNEAMHRRSLEERIR